MKPFRLYEPTTVPEVVATLHELGDEAKLYAGGTELLLAMKAGLLSYDALVNVKRVVGLSDIAVTAGTLGIGATASHSAVEHAPDVLSQFPLVARVEHSVANVRVRNMGTLVGNLCFAEPHSDPAALLMLYEASVHVEGPKGARSMSVEDFIVGAYETEAQPDEVVTGVSVPAFPNGMRGAYLKFGYHHRPTLGVGAAVVVDDGALGEVRLSLGSIGEKPTRLHEAEAFLRGARIGDHKAVSEAGRLAAVACEPIEDQHGSADYKRHLVDIFLQRAVDEAVERGVR